MAHFFHKLFKVYMSEASSISSWKQIRHRHQFANKTIKKEIICTESAMSNYWSKIIQNKYEGKKKDKTMVKKKKTTGIYNTRANTKRTQNAQIHKYTTHTQIHNAHRYSSVCDARGGGDGVVHGALNILTVIARTKRKIRGVYNIDIIKLNASHRIGAGAHEYAC